jgi:hypothetical protein
MISLLSKRCFPSCIKDKQTNTADEDPLVAVVRHASPAEIETGMIAGEIRKMDGVPLLATLTTNSLEKIKEVAPDCALPWSVISVQLRRSRQVIQRKRENAIWKVQVVV